MSSNVVFRSAVLGAASGLRSMAAPSQTSLYLVKCAERGVEVPGAGVARMLGTRHVRSALAVVAGGEMVFDKLPVLPDRTDPTPLIGRMVMGALSGAAVAELAGDSRVVAGLVGALGALVGAHVGFRVRRALTHEAGLPDIAVALCEDAVAIGLARGALRPPHVRESGA